MATKKEKYESMRIMSLEGSVLYKNEGFTALKNGKPNPGAFRGVLDESLDTLKLAEIYECHEDEIGYPYLEGDHNYCRAIVNVSFERAVKVFESCGNRYVRNGYTVIDADMEDHVCIRTENGRPTLVAIEVSYRDKGGYAPVEHPVSDDILGRYFVYDAESLTYRRSDKVIPTAFTCQDIREHLYNKAANSTIEEQEYEIGRLIRQNDRYRELLDRIPDEIYEEITNTRSKNRDRGER